MTWLPLGYLETKKSSEMKGGVAALFKTLVLKFFCEPDITKPSFSTGIDIGGRSIRFSFKGLLADEKGLKEAYDAGGLDFFAYPRAWFHQFTFELQFRRFFASRTRA